MSSDKKLSIGSWLCPVLLLSVGGATFTARAARINGRINLGGYAATESFSDEAAGSFRNDFLTNSARFFFASLGVRAKSQLANDSGSS